MACLGGLPGESVFSLKRKWQYGLGLHLNKPHDFWNNICWTDKTKVEMFVHNTQQHIWTNIETYRN